MREQTQFVAFYEEGREQGLNYSTISEFGLREPKMLTKWTAFIVALIFEEVLMKTISITRSSNDVLAKEVSPASKPVVVPADPVPVEVQPTFTIAFTLGTRMRDLHDTIIRTVLQQTRGNRLRAAQLLHINPRTIRRRLGKKETVNSVTRAA